MLWRRDAVASGPLVVAHSSTASTIESRVQGCPPERPLQGYGRSGGLQQRYKMPCTAYNHYPKPSQQSVNHRNPNSTWDKAAGGNSSFAQHPQSRSVPLWTATITPSLPWPLGQVRLVSSLGLVRAALLFISYC